MARTCPCLSSDWTATASPAASVSDRDTELRRPNLPRRRPLRSRIELSSHCQLVSVCAAVEKRLFEKRGIYRKAMEKVMFLSEGSRRWDGRHTLNGRWKRHGNLQLQWAGCSGSRNLAMRKRQRLLCLQGNGEPSFVHWGLSTAKLQTGKMSTRYRRDVTFTVTESRQW